MIKGPLLDLFKKPNSDKLDEAEASSLYELGKQAAREERWTDAVRHYNRALVIQRRLLGEDHVTTAQTLNDIGVALTHMGETYAAMTALEEALWIRQIQLGDGDALVAETANNLFLLLHKTRQEQVAEKEEGYEAEEPEDQKKPAASSTIVNGDTKPAASSTKWARSA